MPAFKCQSFCQSDDSRLGSRIGVEVQAVPVEVLDAEDACARTGVEDAAGSLTLVSELEAAVEATTGAAVAILAFAAVFLAVAALRVRKVVAP
jgi:hypothetical protein